MAFPTHNINLKVVDQGPGIYCSIFGGPPALDQRIEAYSLPAVQAVEITFENDTHA
jgi:hypothetical protein